MAVYCDRLCKNVAGDDVGFPRNLPLKKGVLHEEKPLAVEQIVAVLKEPEGGMPVEGREPRFGLRSKGLWLEKSSALAWLPTSIMQ